MKKILVIMLFALSFFAKAQPPCGSSTPAGNTCAQATPICNLNGYCGNTSSSYTANSWGSAGTLFGCGFLGLSSCPGTGLTGKFCGSIENNSFLSFTASATSISFQVWVNSSTLGYGIQIFIFSVANCGTGNVTQYGPCYNPGNVPSGPATITATGLTIGNTYYIMIDGNSGDVCNYTIGANSGIATPVSITPSSTTICSGGTVNLTASGGNNTYTWNANPQLNTTSGANVVATPPSTPGTYTYTVNSNIGTSLCPSSGSATATITVTNCGCTVTAGNSGPICQGSGTPVNLTATTIAGATYNWTGPAGYSSTAQNPTNVPVPSTPGTYNYTVTATVAGVPCTSTTTVTVNTLPNANAGAAQVLSCSASSINLAGSSSTTGVNFAWTGPGIVSGGNSPTPSVNLAGNYVLTVSNPTTGCTNTSNVNVTNNSNIPNVNAGSTTELTCSVTSANLSGSSSTAGVNFSWTGPGIVSGATTPNPTINQPGVYNLTVTNPVNGCTASASVNITSNTTPPNASAGNTSIITCTFPTAILNGSSSTPNVTFNWTGMGIVSGVNTSNPTVNQAGTFTLTTTDPTNGCTATSIVNITSNTAPPNVNAGTNQSLNCINTSVQLNGSSGTTGATYSWTGPGIMSGGNTATPTVNQVGNYTLTVTDASNGCENSAVTTVNNTTAVPDVSIGTPQELNCVTASIQLNGNSSTTGVNYSWVGSGVLSGGNTATPTIDQPGTYTLTVTDPINGCTNNTSTTVVLNNSQPDIIINPAQTIDCNNTNVTISSFTNTPNVIYSWNGPGIVSGGNTSTPNVNQGGVYTLTLTNALNGCTSTNNINEDKIIPNVNFTFDSLIGCEKLHVNFNENSNQPGMNYSWNFGDNTFSTLGSNLTHDYTQTGCFTPILTVTNPINGCYNSISASTPICILKTPVASIYANQTQLTSDDNTVILTNNSTNATNYIWDFGDNTEIINTVNAIHQYADVNGLYTIVMIASNQGYCFDTATIQISVEEMILFYVPNTFTPDGDSYNQTFKAIITSGVDLFNFTFLIFNKWGELIWESHDASVGWDGTYNNKPVQEGTYVWTMQFKSNKNDKKHTYNGHVNIIR